MKFFNAENPSSSSFIKEEILGHRELSFSLDWLLTIRKEKAIFYCNVSL